MTDFGRDIACTDSIRTGRFSTGVRLVAEACYRRLVTPRGSLRGGEKEADYGFDLSTMIGTTNTKALAVALPGMISSELLKDERLAAVSVTVSQTVDGPAVGFDVRIEGTTDEGPFTLVLAVSQVTVELLGITEAA